MKRLLFLLLLFPSLAWGQVSTSGVSLSGCSTGGGAAACSASTDYVGQKNAGYTTATSLAQGYLDCWLYTSTCPSGCSSGTFDTASLNHHGIVEQTATMHIYSASSTTPQSADALLGGSGTITSSTDDNDASSAISGTVAASCNTNYWVCAMATSTNFGTHKTTGQTVYYKNVSGTPPATMGAGWSTEADAKLQLWVTIK